MIKNRNLYFRKTHKLFIGNIALQKKLHYHYSSYSYANSQEITSANIIQPNKIIDIITIDYIKNGLEVVDSEVTLAVHFLSQKIKKLKAMVTFDLSRQKILTPNSPQLFKKAISEDSNLFQGYIHYKFINLTTTQITQQEYQSLTNHKNQVLINQQSMEINNEYKRLQQIVEEKDNVIAVLEEQLDKLTNQTKKLTSLKDRDMSLSKNEKNQISFNINVKPSAKSQNQYRKLQKENDGLRYKIFNMSEKIEELERYIVNLQEKSSSSRPSIIKKMQKSVVFEHPIASTLGQRKTHPLGYSQVNKRLSQQQLQLRKKIQNASKLQDVSLDNELLLLKLKQSVLEIDMLQKQLYQARQYLKTMSRQISKVRNNSKQTFEIKMKQIIEENQKSIEVMKNSGTEHMFETILMKQKENLQIQKESLIASKEEIQHKYKILENQLTTKCQEYQTKLFLLQKKQIQMTNDRDNTKVQLNQIKVKLEKALIKNVPMIDVGVITSSLASSLVPKTNDKQLSINSRQHEQIKNLEKQQKNIKIQKQTQIKHLERLYQRQMQKSQTFQKEFQKFEKRYQELKVYVKKLEESFRGKKQQNYEANILEKIKAFEKIVLKTQQDYYSERIDSLKKEKDNIIEFYYKQIADSKELIDSDSSIQKQEKKRLKQQKQQIMMKEKQIQLEDLEKRLRYIQEKRTLFLDMISHKGQTIQERLVNMEALLKRSQIHRKEQILKMHSHPKQKALKVSFVDTPKMTDSVVLGKNSLKDSSGFMKKSQAMMQASSSLHEMRTKYFEEWNKIQEATRKQVKKLQQENSKLKIQTNSLNRKVEQVKMQKQRQAHTQKMEAKEADNSSKRAIKKLENTVQILENKEKNQDSELNKKKQVITDQKQSIQMLKTQLKKLNDEIEKQIKQNQALTSKNSNLFQELKSYEQTAQKLIDQIEHLNKINSQNKDEFERLLEERNHIFVDIDNTRKAQIDKLKRIRQQLQCRMEREIDSTIRAKGNNSQLFQQNAQLTRLNKQYEDSLALMRLNSQNQTRQLKEKLKMYEEVNIELQKNLMSMAEQFNKLQQQIATLHIQKQALNKQVQTYQKMKEEFKQLQQSSNHEKNDLQYIILDKNEQLKKTETDFMIFQEKMKMVSDENLRIRQENVEKLKAFDTLQQKINQKSLQIIKITQQKSMINIEKFQFEKQIQVLIKQNENISADIKILKQQNQGLHIQREQLMTQLQKWKQTQQQKQQIIENKKPSKRNSKNISRNQSERTFKIDDKKSNLDEEQVLQVIEQPVSLTSIQAKQHDVSIVDAHSDIARSRTRVISPSTSSKKIGRSRKSESIKKNSGEELFSPLRLVEAIVVNNQKQIQLMNTINQLNDQKSQLIQKIEQLQNELESYKTSPQYRHISRQLSKQDNIKITDGSFEHTNQNTNEGTIQMQNLNLTESNQFFQTGRSAQNDYKNLELLVEQLERSKAQLSKALEQQMGNNQKLLKVEEQINKLHEEYTSKIQELSQQYEQKIRDYQALRKDLEEKIESVVGELMQKDGILTDTLRDLQNAQSKIIDIERQIANYEGQLETKDSTLHQIVEKNAKMKIQYRKYEEQAEMEILTLRQKFEQVVSFNKEKDNQLIQLAQKYLNLEDGTQYQGSQMKKVQLQLESLKKENVRLFENNKKIEQERQEFNINRKKLLKKIHQMEMQLMSKHEEIAEANKNASLATAKSRIKIQNIEQQLQDMRKRQEDRQKVVCSLKNQIANYNEECMTLKLGNDQLDYELQRITKELKDIVVHYEREFESSNLDKQNYKNSMKSIQKDLKSKESLLSQMRHELREVEKHRVNAESQLKDVKHEYQKYRNTKQKQYSYKCNEYEIKNNQTQIMKSAYEKLVEQNFCNESKLEQEQEKYKNLFKEYKEKMAKYEQILEDLSKQIQKLTSGPDKAVHDQVLFENQLFRNKITQLQQEQKKKTLKSTSSQEILQMQFRKYKVNKEAIIRNLETEMENYSAKISEFEKINFYLKKESEGLKNQIERLNDQNYDLNDEVNNLQQDIEELKEEVEFYKSKRKQELTKLLNSTNS